MNETTAFSQPVARSVFSIAKEKIYDFSRKTVFSPLTTGNCTIRFCTVSGMKQATSQPHSHRGDELVFTVDGTSVNRLKKEEFILGGYQAIAIPPGTEHTTIVTSGVWQGLSFYCDDCALLKEHPVMTETAITIKSLDNRSDSTRHFQKQSIFSPALKESAFMELDFLSSNTPMPAADFKNSGETVYYVLSGTLSLCWEQQCIHLQQQMAAAVPAGFSHQLRAEDAGGCMLIAASCSSCPIRQRHFG